MNSTDPIALGNTQTDTRPPTLRRLGVALLAAQLDVVAAFAEAARIVSLGSLPMAVITATHRELPADLATSEVDRLNEAWNQGQQDWTALSPAAHLVSVDHTGHHIEIDQPHVVIDEITHLLP